MTQLTQEQKQELIRAALKAREQAVTPYSHFKVGAALREGMRPEIRVSRMLMATRAAAAGRGRTARMLWMPLTDCMTALMGKQSR